MNFAACDTDVSLLNPCSSASRALMRVWRCELGLWVPLSARRDGDGGVRGHGLHVDLGRQGTALRRKSACARAQGTTVYGRRNQRSGKILARSTYLYQLFHQLEIVDVKGRRERVEESRLLAARVRKRVRRPGPDDEVVAFFRVYEHVVLVARLLARDRVAVDVFQCRAEESHGPFCDEEGLVVHLVPVGYGAG